MRLPLPELQIGRHAPERPNQASDFPQYSESAKAYKALVTGDQQRAVADDRRKTGEGNCSSRAADHARDVGSALRAVALDDVDAVVDANTDRDGDRDEVEEVHPEPPE